MERHRAGNRIRVRIIVRQDKKPFATFKSRVKRRKITRILRHTLVDVVSLRGLVLGTPRLYSTAAKGATSPANSDPVDLAFAPRPILHTETREVHLTPSQNRVELRPGQRGRLLRPTLAHVAQSVEHTLGKGEAMGSIPIVGSRTAAKLTMQLVYSRLAFDGETV